MIVGVPSASRWATTVQLPEAGTSKLAHGADGDVFGAGRADFEVVEGLAGERAQVLHVAGLEAGDDDGAVDGDVDGDAGDAVEQHDVGGFLGAGCPGGNGEERGSECCGACEDLLHRMVLSDGCDHGAFPPSAISTAPVRIRMTSFRTRLRYAGLRAVSSVRRTRCTRVRESAAALPSRGSRSGTGR